MRAINHALTGAVIGVMVSVPEVAIPMALVSHFALDTVPHFGIDRQKDITRSWFQKLLILDAFLCVTLVAIIVTVRPKGWLLIAVCAFVAAMPDFMLIPRFYRAKRYGNTSSTTHYALMRFHDDLQTEKPAGAVLELLWLPAMVLLLVVLG